MHFELQVIRALKAALRRELEAKPKESRVSRILRHPAILLLLTFTLTTAAGSWLTYYWKTREWHNEQDYLARQRFLEKKHEVIDESVKAVAETNTAADDILTNYRWTWKPKEVREREVNWRLTSRDWRIASKAIREKLEIYFVDPSILAIFDEIVGERKQVGNVITNLLTKAYSEKDANAQMAEAQRLNNEIAVLLKKLGTQMSRELAQGRNVER